MAVKGPIRQRRMKVPIKRAEKVSVPPPKKVMLGLTKDLMVLTVRNWSRTLHRQMKSKAALKGYTLEQALMEACREWVEKEGMSDGTGQC